jgi:hypothetical protein
MGSVGVKRSAPGEHKGSTALTSYVVSPEAAVHKITFRSFSDHFCNRYGLLTPCDADLFPWGPNSKVIRALPIAVFALPVRKFTDLSLRARDLGLWVIRFSNLTYLG